MYIEGWYEAEREDWYEGYVRKVKLEFSEGDQESTTELCFDYKRLSRFGGKLTVGQLLL